MHRLAERPLRLVGRSGVSLRILSYGPLGPWTDWLAHQNLRSALPPRPALWMLPAGAQVLIVSDLGLLLGPDSATAEAWRQLIADLRHTQVCPLALAPLGPEQLDASLPLPVLRWSPDARPRPVRARGEGKPQPDGLDDLLAMASAVRRLDPPLLRAMRRLVPAAPLNAGLEGALWCHADVDALTTASVRGDAREQHVSG